MGSVRELPLWIRYLVAVAVAGAIFIAIVLFVEHNSGPLVEPPVAPNAAQAAQVQKQDQILVSQQQAPHRVTARTADPSSAAAAAVLAFMRAQVSRTFITGPLDGGAECRATGGTAIRAAFHCSVVSGPSAARLRYPFAVIVAPMVRRVTFCQIVTSPDPSVPSPPVSGACRP